MLGVLTMIGEYTTGMIRSSLTAVRRRLPVLWGKLAVVAVTVGLNCVHDLRGLRRPVAGPRRCCPGPPGWRAVRAGCHMWIAWVPAGAVAVPLR